MIHQIAIDEGPPVCQAHGHGISSRVTVTNRAGVIAVLGKPTSSTEERERLQTGTIVRLTLWLIFLVGVKLRKCRSIFLIVLGVKGRTENPGETTGH